jgi:tetratricopeptide (TPR) repeat protein
MIRRPDSRPPLGQPFFLSLGLLFLGHLSLGPPSGSLPFGSLPFGSLPSGSLPSGSLIALPDAPAHPSRASRAGSSGDGPSPGRQEGSRLSIQDLLARMKKMREDRMGELRGSVDQVLRALDLEAQTHRPAGLAEQKDRLVALGSECAPLLVDSIDPGDKPDDAARLRASTITQALVEQRSPAITARLVEMARTGSPDGRLNATKALSASPDVERASAVLVEVFRSSQGELRRLALTGIAHLGGAENEKVLSAALSAGDAETIKLCLDALAATHATSFGSKIFRLVSSSRDAAPYVEEILAYYRACPEVADKGHVLALVHLAAELGVTNENRGRILELLPKFSDKFDAEVKKELRVLAGSATREVHDGALVTLYLAGDRSARKELLASYDEQIDKNKQWPASYEARGNVYYRVGEYRDAIRDYQKSLLLASNDIRARTEGCYMGLARCYMQQGKLKEAYQELEKAPLSNKQLVDLGKEPVFQKLADHPKYGKIFKAD